MTIENIADFTYDNCNFRFHGRDSGDLLFRHLNDKKSFYEIDVLEFIRTRMNGSGGVAIDAGAFVGTHSIYFAKFCGVDQVYAYEANSETFSVLEKNIDINGLAGKVIPVNKGLGDTSGWCESVSMSQDNAGTNTVEVSESAARGAIPLATLDSEFERYGGSRVRLIKIDVEGMEISVLKGALKIVSEFRPLLCIEMHSVQRMRVVLRMLRGQRYVPIECLGYSPTYILESRSISALRYWPALVCWMLYGWIPARFDRLKWYGKRLAQFFIGESL